MVNVLNMYKLLSYTLYYNLCSLKSISFGPTICICPIGKLYVKTMANIFMIVPIVQIHLFVFVKTVPIDHVIKFQQRVSVFHWMLFLAINFEQINHLNNNVSSCFSNAF